MPVSRTEKRRRTGDYDTYLAVYDLKAEGKKHKEIAQIVDPNAYKEALKNNRYSKDPLYGTSLKQRIKDQLREARRLIDKKGYKEIR